MSEQLSNLESKVGIFKQNFDEFMIEYSELANKQKKTAAHKARKNLLSIRKLVQELRKDIMGVVKSFPKKSKNEVSEPVTAETQVVVPEVQTVVSEAASDVPTQNA